MDPVTVEPWMLYASGVVGLIVLIASAVPKAFGPIGRAIDDWASRKRASQSEADDMATIERDRQIAYLAGARDEAIREMRARDTLIARHQRWDWFVYNLAIKQGCDVHPPPPLLPTYVAARVDPEPGTEDQEEPTE